MNIERLKEMFSEMVLKKDVSKVAKYYHAELLLYTNQLTMNFDEFLKFHEETYPTEIQYAVEYDEETFLEQKNKVAGRMWITTSKPGEETKKIEVMLVVEYKENKIYRLWELTYPDWSQLPLFQQI